MPSCAIAGTLLVRDPDELVGRTGSGSRTRYQGKFFPDHVPGQGRVRFVFLCTIYIYTTCISDTDNLLV